MPLFKSFFVAILLTLAGCAAVAPPPTPEQQAELDQVRTDYAEGRYGDVVRRVARSGTIDRSPQPTRIEAYKLQAFSYCMIGYEQLCEDSFNRIFALDADFALAAGEESHPQWGPVYERVRNAHTGTGAR